MLWGLTLSNELPGAPLPRAPPVPRALADRSKPTLLVLLPRAPPAILYDAIA
jgi:hypothetical protein